MEHENVPIAKREVYTKAAPHLGAHYSQAIVTGDLVYVAGQIPIDPVTGAPVGGSVYEQSRYVLGLIRAILEQAGCTLDDIVKMNCYLSDLHQFREMDRAFAEFFKPPYPARATVGVQLVGCDVEMECVARIGSSRGMTAARGS